MTTTNIDSRSTARCYTGEQLRAVAMPLGGIGTGSVALCGDGSLRQWQLCNNVNHLAFVPHSFFAVRAQREGQAAVSRVLQSDALYKEDFAPVPSVNDTIIPEECKRLLEILPGVGVTEFRGEYPIAEIAYLDEALPVEITLAAYSPFCPLDAETSGLPAVVFQFSVHNPAERPANAHLAATLQNFVGWDGIQNITGVECAEYGGNLNHVLRLRGLTAVVMENLKLPANHPQNGSLCLAALTENANACAAWSDPLTFWNDFTRNAPSLANVPTPAPSPDGRTVNGGLSVPLRLEPGETKTVTFALCWHFPNRYVNWGQGFSGIEDRKSLFWQGNAYCKRFGGAAAVAEYVRDNFAHLDAITRRFRDTFYDSTLPYEILDVVGSQMSIIRTPTCLWTEDGRFFGFEGCCSASTNWQASGGCCPMNCTHVFAYEMSLSALFPDLERAMRETELFHQLHPTGYLPHRVTLPLYLPRPWERAIGGPEKPALDGLLSLVLKTYREHRRNPDPQWLKRAWPKIKQAMRHVMTAHDTEGDGVIRGEQPNTYDISIFGPNTFIGTLYLAALRAAEEMARLQGENEPAESYRERYEKGRTGYDDLLWNGEYWIQIYDPAANPEQNYGTGCHSDHLFGQWWAHNLGLGHVLSGERVRQAAQSIVKYNFRANFEWHKQQPRVYACDDEPGLLICSWPQGGRPPVPTLYSDEIWTGIEYEVAALCFYEGMTEEGLSILRAVRQRYNGERRSPWNDVECGDHYARALSSWALLDAACGYQYDASTNALTIQPRIREDEFRAFCITATGWGTASICRSGQTLTTRLRAAWGTMQIAVLTLPATGATTVTAQLNGSALRCAITADGEGTRLQFETPVVIGAEQELTVELNW